jgi:hypothetical protein
MRPNHLPLEIAPFSQVMARVAVRLVQLDARKHPDAYRYPPEGVRQLSRVAAANCWCPLHPWLLSLAKELACGWSMAGWRDAVQSHKYAPRRLDKVALCGPPR